MEKFNKSVEMILKKDTEEKGIIEGQLITHSVIDSYGDYFDKEALDKVNKEKTYFLLHMHEWSKEIGTLKVYQDEKGNLKFTAKLDLSTDDNGNAINQDAQKVYSMMKNNGANYEMSVGGFLKQREFGKVQTDIGEVDARIIKEFEVVEGSVVLKGAVPGATVQTVKNENINKNNEEDNVSVENKNIEKLEKGMKNVNENVEKTNEKVNDLEEKFKQTSESINKMAETLDELLRKEIQNPDRNNQKEAEAFEKYLRTGEKNIDGLMTEKITSTSQVSVLIPPIRTREILKEVKENSNFLMKGKIYSGSGSHITIFVRDDIAPKNQALAEGAGNTQEGEISYKEITISAGRRQAKYPVTDDAKNDSEFDLVSEMQEAISEDFGTTLSELTVRGVYNESAKQYIEGFLTNTEVINNNSVETATAKKVTWEDMVNLETSRKKKYRKNGVYYVSTKLYGEMKLWKDANGNPLWNTIKDGATMRFNGYPVEEEEYLDDIATGKFPAVFCDFGKVYGYFLKKNFQQEQHRDPDKTITTLFTRIYIGGKVIRPQAMAVLKVK